MATVTIPDVPPGSETMRDRAIATLVLRRRLSLQEATNCVQESLSEVETRCEDHRRTEINRESRRIAGGGA